MLGVQFEYESSCVVFRASIPLLYYEEPTALNRVSPLKHFIMEMSLMRWENPSWKVHVQISHACI
jgi:hypothetical protein